MEIFSETSVKPIATYTVPYLFKTGTYKVSFSTSKSSSEKYYLDNDGILYITKSNMNSAVNLRVTYLWKRIKR